MTGSLQGEEKFAFACGWEIHSGWDPPQCTWDLRDASGRRTISALGKEGGGLVGISHTRGDHQEPAVLTNLLEAGRG